MIDTGNHQRFEWPGTTDVEATAAQIEASMLPIEARLLTPAAWDDALGACPNATFFHSAAWLQAVASTFKTTAFGMRFQLDANRWALVPISIRTLAKGALKVLIVGETGAYGGLASPQPISDQEVTDMFLRLRENIRDLEVVGNPFSEAPHVPVDKSRWSITPQATHLLDLKPYEALRSGFSRGAKARGNKARRTGLVMRRRRDEAAIQKFYELYLDSAQRWGERLTWLRPRMFFEELMVWGGDAVHLMFAETAGGEAVSAIFLVQFGPRMHYIAGATSAHHLDACASNFLVEEALRLSIQKGLKVFDFGPSNGLNGVIQFKESFGAVSQPFTRCRCQSIAGSLYTALRRHLPNAH